MSEQPLLEMQAVEAHWPETAHLVLRKMSLQVEAGEVVALMGPSGSGKTSVVAASCGLLAISSGRRRVAGRAPTNQAGWARLRREQIGVVDQYSTLFDALTVAENVALPLELARRRGDRRSVVAAVLDRVGLADRARRYPGDLSGGERQRAVLARAIVGDRRLLLADEPTGSLDSASAEEVVRVLVGQAREGSGVLLVTHDPGVAAWADRTVFLRDGHVAERASSQVVAP